MHWQTPIEHELQIHPRTGHEAELGALIDNLVDGAAAHRVPALPVGRP